MRIGIIIDSLAVGGAQKHVRQLACALTAAGHAVTVFVLNDLVVRVYAEPLLRQGARLVVIGRSNVLSSAGVWRIAWHLWRERMDGVITVLFVSDVIGRLAAQLAGGVPVLEALQARNVNYAWWQRLVLRVTAGLSAFTVSNSRSALAWASRYEGARISRSGYIRNAIDPSGAVGRRPSWVELGFSRLESRRVVGSFGRLDPQKGYDVLLDALALLAPSDRTRLMLLVFGEGPERARLEGQRKRLGLEDVVEFPGVREDVSDLLSRFDVYVQPSRFEGTPNAVLEALAAGVPVVASAVDGLLELGPTDGMCLLPVGDALAWSRALVMHNQRQCWFANRSTEVPWTTPGTLAQEYVRWLILVTQKNRCATRAEPGI